MMANKDDSRDHANRIRATLEMLQSYLPDGFTVEQANEVAKANLAIGDAIKAIKAYVKLRNAM